MEARKLHDLILGISFRLNEGHVALIEGKQEKAEHELKGIHDVILMALGDPMEAGYMVDDSKEVTNHHSGQNG